MTLAYEDVDYSAELEFRPAFGATSLHRGHVYYVKKEYLKAMPDFEHAFRHGADPVLAHYNLALCQLSLQNSSEAVQHLRRCWNCAFCTPTLNNC